MAENQVERSVGKWNKKKKKKEQSICSNDRTSRLHNADVIMPMLCEDISAITW